MKIDIAHTAELAQLEFTGSELAEIKKDMEKIVEMVSGLPDLCGIADDDKNYAELREDTPENKEFTREEMLENAPLVIKGCFAIPKTVAQ